MFSNIEQYCSDQFSVYWVQEKLYGDTLHDTW